MMSIVRYVTTLVAHPLNFPEMMNWMNEYGKKEYKKDRSFLPRMGPDGIGCVGTGRGEAVRGYTGGNSGQERTPRTQNKKDRSFYHGWDWMGGELEFRVS